MKNRPMLLRRLAAKPGNRRGSAVAVITAFRRKQGTGGAALGAILTLAWAAEMNRYQQVLTKYPPKVKVGFAGN